MTENPFESPSQPSGEFHPVVGSNSREELRQIATLQKGLLLCLLAQIVVQITLRVMAVGQVRAAAAATAPPEPSLAALGLSIALLIIVVAGAVYAFRLGIKVSGQGMGILLGILSLIPCLGLIALLTINGKATNILKANGIKVGFMGADPKSI